MNGSPGTTGHGQRTTDGIDLLTVVMHELGHLLGYEHSDDAHDLMAPVLSVSPLRTSAFALRPSSMSGAEAFEPFGQAEWRRGASSFVLRPASPREDDVFAEIGRNGGTAEDRGEEAVSELLASTDGGLLAARTAKSGEETFQARVPRRSQMQRFERELDTWFAELAVADGKGED
jgi:hypothetical protein